MKNHKLIASLSGLLAMVMIVTLLFSAACVKEEEKPTIVLPDFGWTSAVAVDNIVKLIIEEDLGYKVDMPLLTIEAAWAGLDRGDVDIYMENWMPNQMAYYTEYVEQKGTVEDLGTNYPTTNKWYVPSYVCEEYDIHSVDDLHGNGDLFAIDGAGTEKGDMLDGDPSWRCVELNEMRVTGYGLDDEFEVSAVGSEWAMIATIKKSIARHEPILFYMWGPHWMFGVWEVTALEEPEYSAELWNEEGGDIACGWNPDSQARIIVNGELKDKAPDVYAFLQNWSISMEEVSALIVEIEEIEGVSPERDPVDVAREWIEENRATVDQMLGK